MFQTIKISNLLINAKHGVYDTEKQNSQRFIIDCSVLVHRDTFNDELNSTINYADCCDLIANFTLNNSFNLIETLADKLCLAILKKYDLAKEVSVTVKKPDAPLDYKLKYVAVESRRVRQDNVFIALGSNLGDREFAIERAIRYLNGRDDCKVLARSSLYQTKPYGNTNQPNFLNAVLELQTTLSPQELLSILKQLEVAGGRQEREKWGARELDLDILLYGKLRLNSYSLTNPHPDLTNRSFVLTPFCEIASDFIHPIFNKSIAFFASALKNKR